MFISYHHKQIPLHFEWYKFIGYHDKTNATLLSSGIKLYVIVTNQSPLYCPMIPDHKFLQQNKYHSIQRKKVELYASNFNLAGTTSPKIVHGIMLVSQHAVQFSRRMDNINIERPTSANIRGNECERNASEWQCFGDGIR